MPLNSDIINTQPTSTPTSTGRNRRSLNRWQASPWRVESERTVGFEVAVVIFIVTWLAVTGWIVTKTSTLGSPDEAANRNFITQLASTGDYHIPSPLSPAQLKLFHPRSVLIQGTHILPGSFLGLIQVGAILDRLAGPGASRMLTPLLSLACLLALYSIFRRFWSRGWSLLAVSLLAIHPVFLQFATLPYMHNGAFAAMLGISGLALLRLLELPTKWRAVIFGMAYGLALYFRPIEVLWTGPIVAIVLLARGQWKNLSLATLIAFLFQFPWLATNRQLYGSWFSSGYTPDGIFSDQLGTGAVTALVWRLFVPPGGWSWHWLSSAWWF